MAKYNNNNNNNNSNMNNDFDRKQKSAGSAGQGQRTGDAGKMRGDDYSRGQDQKQASSTRTQGSSQGGQRKDMNKR